VGTDHQIDRRRSPNATDIQGTARAAPKITMTHYPWTSEEPSTMSITVRVQLDADAAQHLLYVVSPVIVAFIYFAAELSVL
jgi:hypothetical protein